MFSSIAIIKPKRVTAKAISLRYQGMVICWMFMGLKFIEIKKPAKILPINRRLIALLSGRLFSLRELKGENRGWPIMAKKIIRELYTAVSEVATRVINRAQALVYDVLADSMIRSLE